MATTTPIRSIPGDPVAPVGTELIVIDNGVTMQKATINDAVAPKAQAMIDALNLGTASQADTTAFATAAQGGKADSAVQPTATDASAFGFVLDEDDMASDSDTKVPTQQSVKAYADSYAPIFNPVIRRNLAQKLGRQPDIYDFHTAAREGSVSNWGTDQCDCKGALQDYIDFINAATAGNDIRSLRLPDGVFRYTATPVFEGTKDHRGVDICGAGQQSSVLLADGAIIGFQADLPQSGWWFRIGGGNTFGHFSVRNLALTTTNSDTANLKRGFELTGSYAPTFRDVFIGPYSAGAQQFDGALYSYNTGQGTFDNVNIVMGGPAKTIGTAFEFATDSDATDFFLTNCRVYYGDIAVKASNGVEGVSLGGCTFVAQNKGVEWLNSVGGEPQLTVMRSHINVHKKCIDLYNVISSQIIGNNLYALDSDTTIIDAYGMARSVISGNSFKGAASSNVLNFDGANGPGLGWLVVDDNAFHIGGVGINIGSAAEKIQIGRNNRFEGVTTRWAIAAGAKNIMTPDYGVEVTKNGNQSIPTATATALSSWTEVKNTASDWVASAGAYTVPAEVYQVRVDVGVQWSASTPTGDRQLWLQKVGLGNIGPRVVQAAAAGPTYQSLSYTADVTPGDVLQAWVQQSSGAALNIVAAGTFMKITAI